MALISGETKETESIKEAKTRLKKELWQLLPRKVKGAKKEIIGKKNMSDSELETQLDLYGKKYTDAKNGADVFETQSNLLGVTQAEFRAIVIKKGDAFKISEKKINDLIEAVRQLLEEQVDSIKDENDIKAFEEKLVSVDRFSISTPASKILGALSV